MHHPARQGPHRGCPAQKVLDPCQQFTPVEWLADVVVGAKLQTHDAVNIIGAARQQDDANFRPRALFAGDLQPVLALQIYVGDQQVCRAQGQDLFRLFGCIAFRDAVAERLEVTGKRAARDRLVLDNYDMGRSWRHQGPGIGPLSVNNLLQKMRVRSWGGSDVFTKRA